MYRLMQASIRVQSNSVGPLLAKNMHIERGATKCCSLGQRNYKYNSSVSSTLTDLQWPFLHNHED